MQPHSTTVFAVCRHCGCQFMPTSNSKGWYCCRGCRNAYQLSHWQDRFWRFVQKSEGCWLWTGALKDNGYGVFGIGRQRHNLYVHRLSWELHYAPIPVGMNVCHSCDALYAPGDITYRQCVRPDHLFLGSTLDNMRDAKAKGRISHGVPKPGCSQPGETNSRAKLDREAVLRIRQLFTEGRPISVIAAMFSLSNAHTHRIIHRERWAHLE